MSKRSPWARLMKQYKLVFLSCILKLEEIASLISIPNPLMDQPQSCSRHVTPTTICGEKNCDVGEVDTPEMTGSIPLCIMVHGVGGSVAWNLLVSFLFQEVLLMCFSSCFVLCFLHWLCSLMYISFASFHTDWMVFFRNPQPDQDADWQTWVEILSQRFPDWVLWPLQKLRAASSFMGRDFWMVVWNAFYFSIYLERHYPN